MNIFEMGEKNPNYLGSFDLVDLNPPELVLTIKVIREEKVTSSNGTELLTAIHFQENYKPMLVNATNKKILSKLFGTKETDKMEGKRITVYVDKVKAFGKLWDALRIRDRLPVAQEDIPKCEICNHVIKPLGKLNALQVAAHTKKNYGLNLCAECATKEKEKKEREENLNENNQN